MDATPFAGMLAAEALTDRIVNEVNSFSKE